MDSVARQETISTETDVVHDRFVARFRENSLRRWGDPDTRRGSRYTSA